jgi:hypothetical protein
VTRCTRPTHAHRHGESAVSIAQAGRSIALPAWPPCPHDFPWSKSNVHAICGAREPAAWRPHDASRSLQIRDQTEHLRTPLELCGAQFLERSSTVAHASRPPLLRLWCAVPEASASALYDDGSPRGNAIPDPRRTARPAHRQVLCGARCRRACVLDIVV